MWPVTLKLGSDELTFWVTAAIPRHGWIVPISLLACITETSDVRSSKITARLEHDGAEVVGSSPEEMNALVARELPLWRRVVKDSGARVE